MPDHLLHTIAETGEILRVGRSKVFELMGTGELKSILIGRRRLVPDLSIQAYVADRLEYPCLARDLAQPPQHGVGQANRPRIGSTEVTNDTGPPASQPPAFQDVQSAPR